MSCSGVLCCQILMRLASLIANGCCKTSFYSATFLAESLHFLLSLFTDFARLHRSKCLFHGGFGLLELLKVGI